MGTHWETYKNKNNTSRYEYGSRENYGDTHVHVLVQLVRVLFDGFELGAKGYYTQDERTLYFLVGLAIHPCDQDGKLVPDGLYGFAEGDQVGGDLGYGLHHLICRTQGGGVNGTSDCKVAGEDSSIVEAKESLSIPCPSRFYIALEVW